MIFAYCSNINKYNYVAFLKKSSRHQKNYYCPNLMVLLVVILLSVVVGQRPPPQQRRFVSAAAVRGKTEQIVNLTSRLADATLATMFQQCYPNTLDTNGKGGFFFLFSFSRLFFCIFDI